MNIVLKLFGVACFVATAFWILIAIVSFTTPEVGAVVGIFCLAFAIAFALIGRHLFRKSKPKTSEVTAEAPVAEAPAPDPTPIHQEPSAVEETRKSTFSVAGIYYRQKNVKGLLLDNSDYEMTKREIIEEGMEGQFIYKYEKYYGDADLVPEPNNPHDPNAIKVMINGTHIGYVPANKTKSVKQTLNNKSIISVVCEIFGGPYKILPDEESSIERGSTDYKSNVYIEYK